MWRDIKRGKQEVRVRMLWVRMRERGGASLLLSLFLLLSLRVARGRDFDLSLRCYDSFALQSPTQLNVAQRESQGARRESASSAFDILPFLFIALPRPFFSRAATLRPDRARGRERRGRGEMLYYERVGHRCATMSRECDEWNRRR